MLELGKAFVAWAISTLLWLPLVYVWYRRTMRIISAQKKGHAFTVRFTAIRELGVNRHTVRKFNRDIRCERHVICNGVLMTKTKMKGNQGKEQ